MSTDENTNDHALLDAILDQDYPRVHHLILNGGNVNQRPRFGDPYDTLLHVACEIRADARIARRLIDANIDVNVRDDDDRTPLHIAARNMNADVVRLLIEKNADMNAVDFLGTAPLPFSIASRCQTQRFYDIQGCEAIRELIDNNADVMQCNENRSTPLHVAAASGQMDVVGRLLEKRAVVDALDIERRTPLNQAIRTGHPEIVYKLLTWGACAKQCNNDPNATIPDPVAHPNLELIDDLSTPLHQAAIYELSDVISTLVDHGADLYARDTNGRTPIDLAILYGHHDTTRNLNDEIYRLGQERKKQERTLQVMMGNTKHTTADEQSWFYVLDEEIVRKILDKGVDFDSDDEFQTESEYELENGSYSETGEIESDNDADEEHIINNWNEEGYESASTGASNDSWNQ
jgi:ankyrin repeat protein